MYEEVLKRIHEVASSVREALAGADGEVVPRARDAVFKAAETQPDWARACVWDTSDPDYCVQLQPFSEEEPPVQQTRAEFFVE